jgi:hypothetical protein
MFKKKFSDYKMNFIMGFKKYKLITQLVISVFSFYKYILKPC